MAEKSNNLFNKNDNHKKYLSDEEYDDSINVSETYNNLSRSSDGGYNIDSLFSSMSSLTPMFPLLNTGFKTVEGIIESRNSLQKTKIDTVMAIRKIKSDESARAYSHKERMEMLGNQSKKIDHDHDVAMDKNEKDFKLSDRELDLRFIEKDHQIEIDRLKNEYEIELIKKDQEISELRNKFQKALAIINKIKEEKELLKSNNNGQNDKEEKKIKKYKEKIKILKAKNKSLKRQLENGEHNSYVSSNNQLGAPNINYITTSTQQKNNPDYDIYSNNTVPTPELLNSNMHNSSINFHNEWVAKNIMVQNQQELYSQNPNMFFHQINHQNVKNGYTVNNDAVRNALLPNEQETSNYYKRNSYSVINNKL